MNIPAAIQTWLWRLGTWALIATVTMLAAKYLGVPKVDPGPIPMPTLEQHKEIDTPDVEPLFFCGRTESIRDNASLTKPWPNRRITWTVNPVNYRGMPVGQVHEAFRVAWAAWAEKLDIEPVWVDRESEANVNTKFGRIVNEAGKVDGPGNVLAWSELSDGRNTQKHQLFDDVEKWGVFSGQGSGVDLVRVASHEIGHVLGLLHDDGNGNALMDPIYSRTIRFPTTQDINRAIAMGYKPKPVNPPNPMPANPGLTISFPVTATAADVAEALRKSGFKVEAPAP